jgi:hypothetical protein
MSGDFSTSGSRLSQPGGTPGGLGKFVLGVVLTGVGLYLVFQQTLVASGYWSWWGSNTFGLTLVPLVFGLALLFYDSKNLLGWLFSLGGVAIIASGVLLNLHVYFQATSLYNLLIMLALIAAGLGLIARSLRAH